jgi:hypothetical protein
MPGFRGSAGVLAAVAITILPAMATGGSGLAAAASPSPGGPSTFVGTTSQFPCRMDIESTCGVVGILMPKSMARLNSLTVGFEAKCQAPGKFYGTRYIDLRLPTQRSHGNRTASFAHHQTLDQTLPGDLTATIDVNHSGKVTYGKKGRGRFQVTIAIRDAGGEQVDTCVSGPITYRVTAAKPA